MEVRVIDGYVQKSDDDEDVLFVNIRGLMRVRSTIGMAIWLFLSIASDVDECGKIDDYRDGVYCDRFDVGIATIQAWRGRLVEAGVIDVSRPGYVYVVRGAYGYCKIGSSSNFDNRLDKMQTMSPIKLETILLVSCEDMLKSERFLQSRYLCRQERGEWYKLSNDDIDWITRHVTSVQKGDLND